MKTKKLFSLSSFLEKSFQSENTFLEEEMNTSPLTKQPFLLPSSHFLHYVYGFKKNSHPYIIHVAQLDTDSSNELWEVKISKLAFGKDLKTYEKLEMAIDSKSMRLYTEILETILPEISEKIRSKVRCLVFPFPHQLEFSKLETFNLRIKKVIQKVLPSLTKHNISHPQSQKAKWAYFSSLNLNSVFDAFLDQTTVDIDKVMAYFLENPEEFKPQKKVIVTNEVDQFPELMNVKEEDEIPTDEELFSEFCKEVLGNEEELVSKHLNDKDYFNSIFPKFMSFLNISKGMAVSSPIGKKILEKFKGEEQPKDDDNESELFMKFQYIDKFYELYTVKFDINSPYNYAANNKTFDKIADLDLDEDEEEKVFDLKSTFNHIIKRLFPGEEFEKAVSWLLSLLDDQKDNFSDKEISNFSPTLRSFIKWCFGFIAIIKKNENFDNFNEYFLPEGEKTNVAIKNDEDNSLILDLLKIQSIYITSNFDANINYLLKKDEFNELAKQREKIFATRQVDFDSFIETKRSFDLIIKKLDYSSNWEESVEILLSKNENNFLSKQKELYSYSLSFVSWIKTYKEYWKTKDFDSSKSIYFNECLPSYEKTFPFSNQFNFFKEFNKTDKSEEEKTFELFLKELCKENSFDSDSIVSLNIESSNQLKTIKQSILEFDYKETDEFNNRTISNFRNWIEKQLQNVVILSREKTFGFNLDDLEKPKTKENLEILEKKQYFNLFRDFISGNLSISSFSIPKETQEEKAKFIGELLDYFSSTEIFSSIPENQLNEIKEEYKDSIKLLLEDRRDKMRELAESLSDYFDPIITHPKYKTNIYDYTKSSYSDINLFLRGMEGLDREGQENVLNLVEAFFQENSTLKENLVVARGTSSDRWLNENLAGEYVIDAGIFSSSIVLDTAKEFADKYGLNGVIYIILLPKGTRGMYIEKNSNFSHEKEFLISPGSVFKILSIENRKFSQDKSLNKSNGLVYFLLHVGTITTKVLDERFYKNPSWNALKEKIAM